jgi:SET domain-containing protein
MRRKQFAATYVAYTDEQRGWGLFASATLAEGDMIHEYAGEVISNAECEKRKKKLMKAKSRAFYFAQLSERAVIDAGAKGTDARFANHSCEPNAELHVWHVDRILHLALLAVKPIKAGDEITWNYGADGGFSNGELECFCGSKCCNGVFGKVQPPKV